MRKTILASLACAAVMFSASAQAQQPATPAAPAGPMMYGSPGVSLEQAKKAIDAAAAEAKKNNWLLAIAVTSNGGNLVAFNKMDGTQFGSIAIAIHKAKAAATFKRPTKAFADAIAASPGNVALLSLDGIIASEGGIPIVADGKIIGAIGCSGATGAQDGQACTAGLNALK
jgi:glc operon protein GlcG